MANKGEKMSVSQFTLGNLLGRGAYATVVHGVLKSSQQEYALKVVEKCYVLKHRKIHFVHAERKALHTIGSHPFILRLFFTFQDDRRLYFALELCHTDLNKYIQCQYSQRIETQPLTRGSILSEETVKIFTAQIFCALMYIHSQRIIHRDVKCENILISPSGVLKLGDFGTALFLDDEDGVIESDGGFVGTAEYVSPEVLSNQAIDSGACDLWALGCIVYKMIQGATPFFQEAEFLIYQAIKSHISTGQQIIFESSLFDSPTEAFIRGLLDHDVTRRLNGPGFSIQEGEDEALKRETNCGGCWIQHHPFFNGLSWDDLSYEKPSMKA